MKIIVISRIYSDALLTKWPLLAVLFVWKENICGVFPVGDGMNKWEKNEMKFWLLEVIGLGAVTSVSQVV